MAATIARTRAPFMPQNLISTQYLARPVTRSHSINSLTAQFSRVSQKSHTATVMRQKSNLVESDHGSGNSA